MIPPPLSPYGIFHGTLFQYSSSPSLVAFESIPSPLTLSSTIRQEGGGGLPKNKCILLGGLSDGLIPLPYTKLLEEACHSIGWSLIQPLFSSSYTGFGHGTIDQDVLELNLLLHYLKCHHNAQHFAFVGHSTGCQISMHFINHGKDTFKQLLRMVVLQAPVSDREYPMFQDLLSYQENVQLAESMIAMNQGEEMMPRKAFWTPITASRYISLHSIHGKEDYFSSDLTDEQYDQRYKAVRTLAKQQQQQQQASFGGFKVLVVASELDEYVPPTVNIPLLIQRLCHVMNHDLGTTFHGNHDNNNNDGNSTLTETVNSDKIDPFILSNNRIIAHPLFLHKANHNLSQGNVTHFIETVKQMLQSVNNVTITQFSHE